MKHDLLITFSLIFLFIILPCCRDKKPGDVEPHIVPYLDCIPSETDGQGRAIIKPEGPFPAGSRVDFEITFTIGEAGIAPGGFVILQISPWWGWSQPQNLDPRGDGFTTVTPSFHDSSFQVKILSMHRILVFSRKRPMSQGETITFKYSKANVDMYAEAEELFMFFVDADGDGHCKCIINPPTVRTLARDAVRLNVVVPSQANPGDTIRVSAAPLDAAGNWSTFPAGTFTLTGTCDGKASIKKGIDTDFHSKNRGNLP